MGVHPGVLDGTSDPLSGMPALMHRVRRDAPRRRTWVWASAVAVAALAAGIAWWMVPAAPAPSAPIAVFEAPASDAPEQTFAPEPSVVVEAPPAAGAPRPRTVVAAPESMDDDGIAMAEAEDWPRPPFEDLRTGQLKGATPTVRAAQLVLSGTARVGHDMALTVVTSSDTPVEVCVDGPERGVVWDGAVDAGRTELTRGGRSVSFAFGAPGRYRFTLSTGAGGATSCASPVHVVEVEVAR
jgi:hypothetical protein